MLLCQPLATDYSAEERAIDPDPSKWHSRLKLLRMSVAWE